MSAPVWLVGAGGRTPFVGHFRGTRLFGALRLAWAGRVAGTAGVTEGFAAAEAARDALAEMPDAESPAAQLRAAAAALAGIDPRWTGRGDTSVLIVATEGGSSWATAVGLAGVYAPSESGWRAILPAGHALLGEPGVPTGVVTPIPTMERWVAVPAGHAFPTGDVAAACGARG